MFTCWDNSEVFLCWVLQSRFSAAPTMSRHFRTTRCFLTCSLKRWTCSTRPTATTQAYNVLSGMRSLPSHVKFTFESKRAGWFLSSFTLSLQEFVKGCGSITKRWVDELLDKMTASDHLKAVTQIRQVYNFVLHSVILLTYFPMLPLRSLVSLFCTTSAANFTCLHDFPIECNGIGLCMHLHMGTVKTKLTHSHFQSKNNCLFIVVLP